MVNGQSKLAERVHTLRERKGWTLAETASRAGMSTSMLWKVENGHTSLTYQKLMKLAEGLGVPVGELFEKEETSVQPGGRRVIDRKGELPTADFGGNMHHFFATDIAHKHYFPVLVEVRARPAETKDAEAHGGEEFAFVLDGAVEFRCEGYAPAILQAGDSVYFDASLKHRYVCAEGELAKMVCVYSSTNGVQSHSLAANHPLAMQVLSKKTAPRVVKSAAAKSVRRPASTRLKRRS